jgi:hypothetical protein
MATVIRPCGQAIKCHFLARGYGKRPIAASASIKGLTETMFPIKPSIQMPSIALSLGPLTETGQFKNT